MTMEALSHTLTTRRSVEWPRAWRTVPLWSLFERIKDVGHPDEEMLSVYRDYGVVKKNSRDDNANKTAENRDIYQLVDEGWLVVNRMKAWQGSAGISSHRGIVSGHYICYCPKHGEDSRFLNWLLRSDVYTAEYARLSRGVRPNQIEIDNDGLRVLPVRLPRLEEQRRIADFLDAETARIDRLAGLRRLQFDLLAIRERSGLAESIGGLDGGVVRVKHLVSRLTSGPRGWGELIADEGSTFLRITNIPRQGIDLELSDLVRVNAPGGPERERTRTRDGDVLVSITADIGSVAVVDQRAIDGNVSQHVALLRPKEGICHPRWLAYAIKSPIAHQQLTMNSYGGTKVGLGLADVGNLVIPALSFAAQEVEAAQMDELMENLRRSRSLLQRQLVLLGERRNALITAAVTGQIDVTTTRRVSEELS